MLDLLLKRRSIRRYQPKAVEAQALQKVLQAALLAPSSRGRNPWEFVVIEDKNTLKALGQCRHPQQAFLPDTPAAIVYKATWPDEKAFTCTVSTLYETAHAHGITKTALVLVGDVITHQNYKKSRLYAADFSTEFRQAKEKE